MDSSRYHGTQRVVVRALYLVPSRERASLSDATQPASPGVDLLAKVASLPSDPTGLETFARYVWQAKQAVRQWLTCLRGEDGPVFAVCERVEDLVLVYPDRIRFIQLKTREKGSWSVAAMCDRGLDALVRSYAAARKAEIHQSCSFELWLEGPLAASADATRFAETPISADKAVRAKLAAHGIPKSWVEDFLARLAVEPGQPTETHIDAVAMWELHALWSALSSPEIQYLYEQLLNAASAAQTGGADQPASIQVRLAAAFPHVRPDLPEPGEQGCREIDQIREQVLSRGMLIALTPPIPGEREQHLLARIASGSTASLMELKMKTAGASPALVERMQQMRADMEVQRQLLLASRDSAVGELEDLARRVLGMAGATASRVNLSSVTNPAAAGRPAEVIAADLLARPGDMGHCDRKPILDRDEELIFGYLGHLSDTCRFKWGLT